jgi:hypothetical protein
LRVADTAGRPRPPGLFLCIFQETAAMTEKIGEVVTKWWPLILATLLSVCAVASMWGISTAQIASLGTGQARIEAKLEVINAELGAAKTAAAIATMEVGELRERVREIAGRR